jgi:three-Cys-motif partner protein
MIAGDIWRQRLDKVFGATDWFDLFYKESPQTELFAKNGRDLEKACVLQKIGDYYHGLLKSIFPTVAKNPALLKNSKGSPLFQLHFAAGNEKGGKIAVKIAQHILNGI